MYTFKLEYMLTFWAFCQFLKLVSSPIRSWDSGILNFILWNWKYFFVPTSNIFKLNLKIYNINWNLQIIILSQSYHLLHIKQAWKKGYFLLLHNKCYVWNPYFANQKCWSVHLEGRGEGVWKSVLFENVDIFGWPLMPFY